MHIAKIENGKAYKTVLAPNINTEDFLANNLDYVLTDTDMNVKACFVYVNGKVIIDEQATKNKLIADNQLKGQYYIALTDKYMTIDNIYDLNEQQLNQLKIFRKECLIVSDIFPTIPTWI